MTDPPGGKRIEAAKKAVETARGAVEEAEKALRIVRRRFEKESARLEAALSERAPQREKIVRISPRKSSGVTTTSAAGATTSRPCVSRTAPVRGVG